MFPGVFYRGWGGAPNHKYNTHQTIQSPHLFVRQTDPQAGQASSHRPSPSHYRYRYPAQAARHRQTTPLAGQAGVQTGALLTGGGVTYPSILTATLQPLANGRHQLSEHRSFARGRGVRLSEGERFRVDTAAGGGKEWHLAVPGKRRDARPYIMTSFDWLGIIWRRGWRPAIIPAHRELPDELRRFDRSSGQEE